MVLAAVAKSGSALWYASEDFRADKEVALAAVVQNGFALQYAAAHMRADKQVVLVRCGTGPTHHLCPS